MHLPSTHHELTKELPMDDRLSVEKFESIVAFPQRFIADSRAIQFKREDGRVCVVGEGCRRNQLDWSRPLNATPDNEVWLALLFAALLRHPQPLAPQSIVVGCPKHLVSVFNARLPKGRFVLELPDGSARIYEIETALAVPESAAHALAYQEALGANAAAISFGFGTLELASATSEGIIDGSEESFNFGLHIAAKYFRDECVASGYDNPNIRPEQYHWWDNVLMRAYDEDTELVLVSEHGRSFAWQDLKPLAAKAISRYATEAASRLPGYFKRFTESIPAIITGGGVKFREVGEEAARAIRSIGFKAEVAPVDICAISAAKGYDIIAKKLFRRHGIGADIGNHSSLTIVEKSAVSTLPKPMSRAVNNHV
jgi:hypothetical protein